jgi:polar amino acid transport system substrate-binding protein
VSLQRRHFNAIALALAAGLGLSTAAFADSALDGVMARKSITIAIPTDFRALRLRRHRPGQPQGPRRRHGQARRRQARREAVELVPVTSANRVPYLQTQQG